SDNVVTPSALSSSSDFSTSPSRRSTVGGLRVGLRVGLGDGAMLSSFLFISGLVSGALAWPARRRHGCAWPTPDAGGYGRTPSAAGCAPPAPWRCAPARGSDQTDAPRRSPTP